MKMPKPVVTSGPGVSKIAQVMRDTAHDAKHPRDPRSGKYITKAGTIRRKG